MQNLQKLKHRPTLYLSSLLLITFFLWAGFFQINEHVRGSGRIITAGKSRVIQHLEGGLIQDIFVEEGKIVEKGDILFNIIDKNSESELKENELLIQSYYIRKQRLESEVNDSNDVIFARKFIEKFSEIVKLEKYLFKSRRLEFIEKISGIKERYKQKVHKLEELSSTVENLKQEIYIVQEQLAIKKKLYDAGAISKSIYLETKSSEKNFLTRISKVEKEIPVVRAERAEILNLIDETEQKWKTSLVDELNTLVIDIGRINERIIALKDKVNRTSIVSPVRGIIDKLSVNTIGGVVQSGQILTEITPIDEKLIAEGRISTGDRGKIWLGIPALSKITAYDYTIYGGIDGVLTYISSDSYFDNKSIEYYKVQVSLKIDGISPDIKIYPGMTIEMGFITGKTSVLNAILKPFWRIRDNALRET